MKGNQRLMALFETTQGYLHDYQPKGLLATVSFTGAHTVQIALAEGLSKLDDYDCKECIQGLQQIAEQHKGKLTTGNNLEKIFINLNGGKRK